MKFLERFWFGCGHCHGGDGCPVMDDIDPEALERHEYGHGPTLVLAVILVFILPLATAIGGAYLAGHYSAGPTQSAQPLWQVAGAVAGFFVGVALARLVFWTRRRLSSSDGGVE
jgi:divalent metal cation (Fe/Co/Zn/Cd) transporter